MRALFRVDASSTIGSGHVMRCLTLARALRTEGVGCDFVSQSGKGDMHDYIKSEGFTVMSLSKDERSQKQDASECLILLTHQYDLLVVDHYQLGKTFCATMRQACKCVMVIDDLADRSHDCDILLDQNLYPQAQYRYQSLVPAECEQLIGPQYTLLRPEFYQAKEVKRDAHVLIGFGGTDPQNLSYLAIDAIRRLNDKQSAAHGRRITADLVVGAGNPWREKLEERLKNMPYIELHVQTNNMAKLMHCAQLMLGGGGTTHWERCKCALPALVVSCAENQIESTEYLASLGACVYLGKAEDMDAAVFAQYIERYLHDEQALQKVSQAAADIVPDKAGTPLVLAKILAKLKGKHDNTEYS